MMIESNIVISYSFKIVFVMNDLIAKNFNLMNM